jgi:hypothetical protein
MKLVPYESFTVVTRDPVDVLVRRLTGQVAGWRWFARQPYVGKVWKGGFKIVPITRYRNSFIPVIRGDLRSGPEGTVIDVTMRLNLGVAAFLCFWCCGIVAGFVSIMRSVTASETAWPVLPVPLFMILFAVGLALGGFWSEVPGRREDITRLLIGPSDIVNTAS